MAGFEIKYGATKILAPHVNYSVSERLHVTSGLVQRLIGAAVPLIRQLREDQKREVRQLVRMIGLEKVASQI
jgi:hypothetical protein